LLAALWMAGCGEEPAREEPAGSSSTSAGTSLAARSSGTAPAAVSPPPPPPTPAEIEAWKSCAARREDARRQPALAGAPGHEQQRVQLSRVRGRSLLWRAEPGAMSQALVNRLAKNKSALGTVRGMVRRNSFPVLRRAIFLRDGYLWSDRPDLALAMVEQLGLVKLFNDQRLFLQRGATTSELERVAATTLQPLRYVYRDGPNAGETAELLLGDRVSARREEITEKPPLHIDLGELADAADFDRLRPEHLTERWLVGQVRYGPGVWAPALFALDGARIRLECEALDAELAARKAAFVADHRVLQAAMRRIELVVREMVREEIPFDFAPERENGLLRQAWERAYLQGWWSYSSEGRSRKVYTPDGHPMPPQVCIDFLTDTWERASGTWFAPAVGDPPKPAPKRTVGGIDFEKLGIENRRSVASFTEFAQKHAELFDVWEIPLRERFRFKDRERFFGYLHEKADLLRPGDMLFIHGFKGGGRPHYHSLIILETDLVTGMPLLVAGNAIKPREQTLEGIMQISPERTLRHRIRVRPGWLEAVARATAAP
jgi:hypothetical protein